MILISKLYFKKSREEKEWYVSAECDECVADSTKAYIALSPSFCETNLFCLFLKTKCKCIIVAFGTGSQIEITLKLMEFGRVVFSGFYDNVHSKLLLAFLFL